MFPDLSAARRRRLTIAARAVIGTLMVALVAAAAVLLVPTTGGPRADDIRFFRIGTGTTGGTYFPVGGMLANAISNPPGSRPCDRGGSCGVPGVIAVAQATQGSVENLKEMRTGTLESALSQADIAFWAREGTGPYKGQQPFEQLTTIASLYVETVHIVVRAESDIRSIADLKGKVVSIGEEGSGTLVEARVILEAYGIAEKDIEPRYLKPGPAGDRLVEGGIDAFFIVGGHPVAAVAEAAARTPIRLLSFDDEQGRNLKERLPFFTESVIGEGVYEGVSETRTLGVGAQWLVRGDVPEDLVYGITRALWHPSTRRLLDNGHPKGPSIQLATATKGLAAPLHPGAARYYREAGVLEEDGAEPKVEPRREPERPEDDPMPALPVPVPPAPAR
ncbi:TAXI family TRAP transporter solute-binding subunit [Skermanella rosea]|uniref:TAXI family TRAP transporter solute-binding subunit n=1 Tax=Skermanella rosea TaxID=1817965 RepID=UPI001E5C6123|nr:TAXI family TRAP transporter solute-binding subunit [Skermanella rosea]UEM02933.1 TAXI family TRAP transporter solute-binding subunit [Skermanella rosea]